MKPGRRLALSTSMSRAEAAVVSRAVGRRRAAMRGWATSRYSRCVSMLKVVLPSLAVVLIALVVIWPNLVSMGSSGLPLGFIDVGKLDDNRQKLVNAYYRSVDSSNQPFTVSADTAEETAPGSQLIALEKPKADVSLKEGAWLIMDAEQGLYRQNTQILDLKGNVNLFHDGGYEMHTDRLRIDMVTQSATGDAAVAGQGPFGDIVSEGLSITQAGKIVVFTGKARLILRPDSSPTMKESSAAHTAAPIQTSRTP